MKNYKEYIDYCQSLAEDVKDNGFEFEGDIHAHITWIAFFLIRNGIHSAYQHIEEEEEEEESILGQHAYVHNYNG